MVGKRDIAWTAVIVLAFWMLCAVLYYGSRPPITCIDGVVYEEIRKGVFVKMEPETRCKESK